MKSAAHQYEDKLLEFAYGELPQHEAEAVDAHVRGCNRCSQSLSEIRGVRATMAQLPMEAAPDAGLESLLAYAEQAARRSNPKAAPSIWKRFLMPLASLAALATVGIVGFRANQEFDTSPAAAVADAKIDEMARAEKVKEEKPVAKSDPAVPSAEEQLARKQQLQEVNVPPVVAAAAPETPAADPSPREEPRPNNTKGKAGKTEAKNADLDGLEDSRNAQTRGDVWGPEPKVAPQSVAKRDAPPKPKPVGNDEQVYREDSSNAAQRGALKDVTKEAPPPPPADKANYGGYGLGTPGGSQLSGGAKAGLSEGESAAPQGSANTAKPSVQAPMKSPPPALEKAAEVKQKQVQDEEAKKEDSKKRAKAEETERRAAEPPPAPVAAAPMPSTSMPSSPSKKKPDFGIGRQMGGSSSIGSSSSPLAAESDDAVAQQSDRLGVNNDDKFVQRKQAETRTQSLENARVASSRGDRVSEIRLAAQVLQAGATGYEKVEALKRICDAYEALGQPESADSFCDQLLQEFPNTAAAKAVADRRRNAQRAPAPAPKRAAERKTMDFQEAGQPKPADAPAQAY